MPEYYEMDRVREAMEFAHDRLERAVYEYRHHCKNIDDVRRNGWRLYGMAEVLAVLDGRVGSRDDPRQAITALEAERVMRRNFSWGSQMEAIRTEFLLPLLTNERSSHAQGRS